GRTGGSSRTAHPSHGPHVHVWMGAANRTPDPSTSARSRSRSQQGTRETGWTALSPMGDVLAGVDLHVHPGGLHPRARVRVTLDREGDSWRDSKDVRPHGVELVVRHIDHS